MGREKNCLAFVSIYMYIHLYSNNQEATKCV
jgi:hypothetical protein